MAACLAALSLGASASSVSASVTIGQLAPGAPASPECFNGFSQDWLQPIVTSGNSYVVPATVATGTVTSWSHNAAAGAGQELIVKVYRKVANPHVYQVVGHDGPRPLISATVNTFQTSIPVEAGDVLGINDTGTTLACHFGFPEEPHLYRVGNLADGDGGSFNPDTGARLNVTAVVNPSSTFTLGATTRNRKKGTATLTINVPNPGELTASGNGVKAASAGRAAVVSKSLTAGLATLLIKAKGKKKKALNETGKVKLNVAVTYTPTGGDPSTQSRKLKLTKG